MEQQAVVEALRERFGHEFRQTEAGGREEMADFLEAEQSLDREEAMELLRALEVSGTLRYLEAGAEPPSPDMMLEAARYGDAIPRLAGEPGLWQIGAQP